MEEPICNIKLSRDNENKEDFYIEYSFNGYQHRKRFFISTDKDLKPFNKEVISNILRKTILEITENKHFWEQMTDILSAITGIRKIRKHRTFRKRELH